MNWEQRPQISLMATVSRPTRKRCFGCSSVLPNKASGPDNFTHCVLNLCADQLARILSVIFNLCFQHDFPSSDVMENFSYCSCPKESCDIINERSKTSCVDVSLYVSLWTSSFTNKLIVIVSDFIDPLQFAYRKNRGIEGCDVTCFK